MRYSLVATYWGLSDGLGLTVADHAADLGGRTVGLFVFDTAGTT
jgi:hypothetical protein